MDSVRATYGQVAFVDNGGFFPEENTHQDVAWFLIDAMKTLGIQAVNIGDADLRFGRAFLEDRVKRTQLPAVSANLLDAKTRKPLFPPYRIVKVGNVNVGFLGLVTDKGNLGPAKDSLFVEEPAVAARRNVAELRKKGADVVVLLSQLGKVESEDLVTAVDGIDAVIVGRNTPLLQKGRMIKNTVACYGGEQGQYACRTVITLDVKKHMTTGDATAEILGPEVGEKVEVKNLVKSFEDGFNEKLRKQEMERTAKNTTDTSNNPQHFLGAEVCMRCHQDEGEQWKTTSHSAAWQTLVIVKKDATPECIACHVVGFQQPGGFLSGTATPAMGNVQCENCHGMGTEHDAFATPPHRVTEQTCVGCHHGENDPEFSFDKKLPKIIHTNRSGETLKAKKVKGPEDASKAGSMMKTHGSN